MANLLLLDVYKDDVKEIQCDKLEDFHEALNCRCFDIVTRCIGKEEFDLYIDDEGLLKSDPTISAINNLGEPMIVGNIIFAKHDYEGETVDLTADEIKHIRKNIQKMYTRNHPEGYNMLVNCEYYGG